MLVSPDFIMFDNRPEVLTTYYIVKADRDIVSTTSERLARIILDDNCWEFGKPAYLLQPFAGVALGALERYSLAQTGDSPHNSWLSASAAHMLNNCRQAPGRQRVPLPSPDILG